MCQDPTVLHDAPVKGKVLPTCLVSALLLSPGAVGVWDGSSDAGPRGARGFELTAGQQQPKADTSCMDGQCMRFLTKFLVRNLTVFGFGFFRFSKFWFESKRSGQRTTNSPRGRYLGSP